MEKWASHKQVGVQFKLPTGLVAFCKYLRQRNETYDLAGSNTVILAGKQLQAIVNRNDGILKDNKHEVHPVVPFARLTKEEKQRAVRHRLIAHS